MFVLVECDGVGKSCRCSCKQFECGGDGWRWPNGSGQSRGSLLEGEVHVSSFDSDELYENSVNARREGGRPIRQKLNSREVGNGGTVGSLMIILSAGVP